MTVNYAAPSLDIGTWCHLRSGDNCTLCFFRQRRQFASHGSQLADAFTDTPESFFQRADMAL